MESPRRALSRGGLGKNAIRKIMCKKRSKKVVSGAFNLCVSGQTLKQGSDRFTIGQTRVCGFCLKCTGILSARFCWEISAFLPVSLDSGDTGKKRVVGVFWIWRLPERSSGLEKKSNTGHLKINAQRNPCLRVSRPKRHSIPPSRSRSHILEKGVVFPSN